jgi:hypothetical protein
MHTHAHTHTHNKGTHTDKFQHTYGYTSPQTPVLQPQRAGDCCPRDEKCLLVAHLWTLRLKAQRCWCGLSATHAVSTLWGAALLIYFCTTPLMRQAHDVLWAAIQASYVSIPFFSARVERRISGSMNHMSCKLGACLSLMSAVPYN